MTPPAKRVYGECEKCSSNSYPFTSNYRATDRVSYLQWATVDKVHKNNSGATSKIILKKDLECSQEMLVEMFATLLQKFRRHLVNFRQQYAFSRALKLNLPANECAVHVDFSENYGCKFSAEVQSVHFGASHQRWGLESETRTRVALKLHKQLTSDLTRTRPKRLQT